MRICFVVGALVVAIACADRTQGPRPGNERASTPLVSDSLALEADVAVMESFPVQLRGTLRVENKSAQTISFDVGGCPVFLRVYGGGGDAEVWDQGDGAICTMILRTVTLEPGGLETFETATASAADVLGEGHPDGTYRVAVYLALVDGGHPEAAAGEIQLAIPR